LLQFELGDCGFGLLELRLSLEELLVEGVGVLFGREGTLLPEFSTD